MENKQTTPVTTNKFKIWWKKHNFSIICFLSTLPLIALGIWGIMFKYQPFSDWQRNNIVWIRWAALLLFIIVIEFVIVVLPIIILNSKSKPDKTLQKFNRDNLKKELRFNLTTCKIALQRAAKERNKTSIQQLHEEIVKTKQAFKAKIKQIKQQNKKVS